MGLTEKRFYEELANVPEIPKGTFEAIERSCRSRAPIPLYALAASLLLAVGIVHYAAQQPRTAIAPVIETVVYSELQQAHDFLNGYDIDESYATLSVTSFQHLEKELFYEN